jgi:hypothetical protein
MYSRLMANEAALKLPRNEKPESRNKDSGFCNRVYGRSSGIGRPSYGS